KSDRQKEIVPVGLRNVDIESKWSKSGYRGWVQGYRLVAQGLVFPEPVPIFAAWRPNNENEANIAIEALLAGDLKVTDVLLGDETFGGGLFLISTKRPADGSSHRSSSLKSDGRGRTTCATIARRPSNCSFNGSFKHWA